MSPRQAGSSGNHNKGCRTCHVRRIECDQTFPACRKCAKKGYECPGYGRDYRWTNAVAVRGHLRGQNVPVRPEPGSSNSTEVVFAGPSLPASSPQLPNISDPLLEHFLSAIAPLMVWIDSERNEYKRLIPLARRQPVLLLSMQAVSAAHLAAEAQTSERLCNEAMTLMSAMIKPMLDADNNVTQHHDLDEERLEALLASMLILSSHSLIAAKPTEAQAHRQAARIITNVLSRREYESQTRFRFLRNQLALYEILACTTLAEADPIDVAPEELFSEYMTILHGITRLSCERQRGMRETPLPSADELELQLDMASGSTLLAAGPLLEGRSPAFRRDFVRVVYIYRHAGILYAFDRLKLQGHESIRAASMAKIYSTLERFENMETELHNLPWPVFIAGTTAQQDESKRDLVRSIFRRLSASTDFRHYLNIIDFFEDLWKDASTDWIELAQRYNLNNSPVIAI